MNTLLLDVTTWDLCVDASGNIAMATDPYALAQDAACAIKLFAGELWFDTTQGVPYFDQILGQPLSLEFMRTQYVAAAMSVPGVVAAEVFFTGIVGRALSGQVQITDATGAVSVANLGAPTL
jgi:hypothetical protein